eukprot:EG_transcript_13329
MVLGTVGVGWAWRAGQVDSVESPPTAFPTNPPLLACVHQPTPTESVPPVGKCDANRSEFAERRAIWIGVADLLLKARPSPSGLHPPSGQQLGRRALASKLPGTWQLGPKLQSFLLAV